MNGFFSFQYSHALDDYYYGHAVKSDRNLDDIEDVDRMRRVHGLGTDGLRYVEEFPDNSCHICQRPTTRRGARDNVCGACRDQFVYRPKPRSKPKRPQKPKPPEPAKQSEFWYSAIQPTPKPNPPPKPIIAKPRPPAWRKSFLHCTPTEPDIEYERIVPEDWPTRDK